jgi:predicted acetyltransferase
MDYGPVPADSPDLRRFLSYAFRPEGGPPDLDEEPPPPATVGEARGLYDGDDLLTVCKHHWFTTRVAGTAHPLAGLSAVATPPERRRQGLVRRLVEHALKEYRDRGAYLTALWPFKHPFYAQFGWALANRYAIQTFEPAVLSEIDAGSDGSFRPLAPDDHQKLGRVLDAESGHRPLFIERAEEWWRKRVFEGWQTDPYVYGWERSGELRGYLVYAIQEDGDDLELRVNELAGVDREARCQLFRFIADHDSQVRSVRLYGPPDDLLFDTVEDPAAVDVGLKPGPMIRLVDVPAAIEARPASGAGSLTINVTDHLADWNDGRFRIDFGGDRTRCTAVDGDPDVACSIGVLSQLYVGYRSVVDLERAGELEVYSDDARTLLDEAFPTTPVFLREGF